MENEIFIWHRKSYNLYKIGKQKVLNKMHFIFQSFTKRTIKLEQTRQKARSTILCTKSQNKILIPIVV